MTTETTEPPPPGASSNPHLDKAAAKDAARLMWQHMHGKTLPTAMAAASLAIVKAIASTAAPADAAAFVASGLRRLADTLEAPDTVAVATLVSAVESTI